MPKSYKVTSIVDRLVPGQGGKFTEQVLITYTTTSGYTGRVSVPKKGLTPETAQRAVEEDAKTYEAILAS